MMSKLRFDGPWSNRPRDLANLSRYAARVLERGVNWQVVSVNRDWTDWLDSPVLYVASQATPKLAEEDYAKLRQFADAGGMLFTHADAASENFNKWAGDLAKKLWPTYEMAVLPTITRSTASTPSCARPTSSSRASATARACSWSTPPAISPTPGKCAPKNPTPSPSSSA